MVWRHARAHASAANTQHADLIIKGVLADDGLVELDAGESPAPDELPEARVSTHSLESQGMSAIACKYVQPLPFMHFPSAKNLHMTVGKRALLRASFPVLALSWSFESVPSRRLDASFGPMRPSNLVSRAKLRSASFTIGTWLPLVSRRRPA